MRKPTKYQEKVLKLGLAGVDAADAAASLGRTVGAVRVMYSQFRSKGHDIPFAKIGCKSKNMDFKRAYDPNWRPGKHTKEIASMLNDGVSIEEISEKTNRTVDALREIRNKLVVNGFVMGSCVDYELTNDQAKILNMLNAGDSITSIAKKLGKFPQSVSVIKKLLESVGLFSESKYWHLKGYSADWIAEKLQISKEEFEAAIDGVDVNLERASQSTDYSELTISAAFMVVVHRAFADRSPKHLAEVIGQR